MKVLTFFVFLFGYIVNVSGELRITTNTRCPTVNNPAILRIEGYSEGSIQWQKWSDITTWTSLDSSRTELIVRHSGDTYRCVVVKNDTTYVSNEIWLCCVLPVRLCMITHAGTTRDNRAVLEIQTNGPTMLQFCVEGGVWKNVSYVTQRYVSELPITTTTFYRLKSASSDGDSLFSTVVVLKPQSLPRRFVVTVHSLYDGTLVRAFESSSDDFQVLYEQATKNIKTPVVVSIVTDGTRRVLKKIVRL